MSLLTYANAADLERWADDRRAQEQLPELARRLILATSDDIRQIEFAACGGRSSAASLPTIELGQSARTDPLS